MPSPPFARRLARLATSVALLAGCERAAPPAPAPVDTLRVLRVHVEPPTGTFRVGEPRELAVTATLSSGLTVSLDAAVYGLRLPTVVAVTDSAVLSARLFGTTQEGPHRIPFTATGTRAGRVGLVVAIAGVADTTWLDVAPFQGALAAWPDTSTLLVGRRREMSARRFNGYAPPVPDSAARWTSDAPAVAAVDPTTGVVTAVAPGQATVRARSGADTASAVIVVPTPAPPVRFTSVMMGDHAACGLADDGAAFCWGADARIPDHAMPDRCETDIAAVPTTTPLDLARFRTRCASMPLPAFGGRRFRALGTRLDANDGGCAVLLDGTPVCWSASDRPSDFVVGPPDAPGSRVHQVPGSARLVAVTTGLTHACGLTAAGDAYCWGRNHLSQLGLATGDTLGQPAPARIDAPEGAWTTIEAAGYATCAIGAAGGVFCWGNVGALGLAPAADACPFLGSAGRCSAAAQRLAVPGQARALALHATGGCALLDDGATWCWGAAVPGAPWFSPGGSASAPPPAVQRVAAPPLVAVSGAGESICGATAGGDLVCWGWQPLSSVDGFRGPAGPVATPTTRATGLGLRQVAGGDYGCGFTTAGTLLCWGRGLFGARGDGVLGASGVGAAPTGVAEVAGQRDVGPLRGASR